MDCRYSGGGDPCGMTVPMIEITAKVMSRNMVSFSEQKKSQSDWGHDLSFVVTMRLLE